MADIERTCNLLKAEKTVLSLYGQELLPHHTGVGISIWIEKQDARPVFYKQCQIGVTADNRMSYGGTVEIQAVAVGIVYDIFSEKGERFLSLYQMVYCKGYIPLLNFWL